ncbi:AraC family transcriptional regulator [Paenibacillus ferrarius]|uniref:AraC family transcriptional regulator n=1 Tax=Paenibacillus ferrarius TaxID=1469647 RepID=UPI003D2C3483
MAYYRYKEFMDEQFPFKIAVKNNAVLLGNRQHAHEYFQICYVIKGTALHNVNGMKATLIKGDLFSIPPNYEHQIELLEGKEAEIVHIDFMPYLLDSSLQGLTDMESFVNFAFIQPFVAMNDRLLPKLNLTFNGQRETEQLIARMLQERERQQDGYTLMIKSNLQMLLVIAGREYAEFLEQSAEKQHVQTNRKHFEKAVDYIKSHYMREIKLQDAAAQATMSPAYFSTMFKLLKGKSFIEYVNDIRLTEAMKLLKQTGHSIEEISYRIGFNHLTHFHRMFKKTTGLTPAEYRKQSKPDNPDLL